MDLINIFKEFDFFTKLFKISHFNRDLNSMKNKTIVIFLTIYLCFVIIKNSLFLILIDDNQDSILINLGDIGYLLTGKSARFILDLCQLTFWSTVLVYLIQYQIFDNQWILEINEIYEQIKTKSMDRRLKLKSTKIVKFFKLVNFSASVLMILFLTSIYVKKFIPSLSFVYGFLEITFCGLFGYQLVIRNIFISIFICQKYIIIFNEINNEIIECFDSMEMNSNDLKSYFNKYYKCCDSLKITNKFFEQFYIILLACFSPISCYSFYSFMFSNEYTYINLIMLIILLVFIILILYLSLMINMIDFEAKKGLHVIHAFAILNKDKQISFQVYIENLFNK